MNQTMLALVVGLLAGVGGSLVDAGEDGVDLRDSHARCVGRVEDIAVVILHLGEDVVDTPERVPVLLIAEVGACAGLPDVGDGGAHVHESSLAIRIVHIKS